MNISIMFMFMYIYNVYLSYVGSRAIYDEACYRVIYSYNSRKIRIEVIHATHKIQDWNFLHVQLDFAVAEKPISETIAVEL